MVPLAELGSRICILGPSNAGKSTLAVALAQEIGCPAIHLDQLAFQHHTNWELRPEAEFHSLHADAIRGESWVIDGNYRVLMPQRFERATSVIWIDPPLIPAMLRYLRRSFLQGSERLGDLPGAKQHFNFELIRYTLLVYPQNRLKYEPIVAAQTIPVLRLDSVRELNRYYRFWGLERP
jgi:hypothetical protein